MPHEPFNAGDPLLINMPEESEEKNFYAAIAHGGTCEVRRVAPEWCKGYLATVHSNADDPVSIQKIKERFGGKKLKLIFRTISGRYIGSKTEDFPDPPRDDCAEMTQPVPVPTAPPAPVAIAAQQGTRDIDTMRLLVETMITGFKETQGSLMALFDSRMRGLEARLAGNEQAPAHRPQSSAPDDAIGRFKELASLLKELETLKHGLTGGAEIAAAAENDGFLNNPIVGKLLEKIVEGQFGAGKQSSPFAQMPAASIPPLPPRAAVPAPSTVPIPSPSPPQPQPMPNIEPSAQASLSSATLQDDPRDPEDAVEYDEIDLRDVTNDELAVEIAERLKTISEEEGMRLVAILQGQYQLADQSEPGQAGVSDPDPGMSATIDNPRSS